MFVDFFDDNIPVVIPYRASNLLLKARSSQEAVIQYIVIIPPFSYVPPPKYLRRFVFDSYDPALPTS